MSCVCCHGNRRSTSVSRRSWRKSGRKLRGRWPRRRGSTMRRWVCVCVYASGHVLPLWWVVWFLLIFYSIKCTKNNRNQVHFWLLSVHHVSVCVYFIYLNLNQVVFDSIMKVLIHVYNSPTLPNRSVGYWRRPWRLWLPVHQPCPPPVEGSSPPPRRLRTPSSALSPTGNANRKCWRGSRWIDHWLIIFDLLDGAVCINLVSIQPGKLWAGIG